MKIQLIHEHNTDGHLLYLGNLIGAYVRGKTLDEALQKIPGEVTSYCEWAEIPLKDKINFEIIQEKVSDIKICDADSDVLFDS